VTILPHRLLGKRDMFLYYGTDSAASDYIVT
jgi:hypothetical protein